MSPILRKKAKLLRKLKPTEPNIYDTWWKLCLEIAENEGCNILEFMIACGIPKEKLFITISSTTKKMTVNAAGHICQKKNSRHT